MRHLNAGRKFSRNPPHRRAMFRNMAAAMMMHERIQTTDAKAKEMRRIVERLVTQAKRALFHADGNGDGNGQSAARILHARRTVAAFLPRFGDGIGDDGRPVDLLEKLFGEIAPRYENRPGGYTRIIKVGFRAGDNAPMSLLEFVDSKVVEARIEAKAEAAKDKAKKRAEAAQEAKDEAKREAKEEAAQARKAAKEEVHDHEHEEEEEGEHDRDKRAARGKTKAAPKVKAKAKPKTKAEAAPAKGKTKTKSEKQEKSGRAHKGAKKKSGK